MLVGQTQSTPPSHNWAYCDDIPGTRCGPDDGPWPKAYQLLEEGQLWRELRTLAKPQSARVGKERKFRVDSLNFQPSPSTATQDRYVVSQLAVHGRLWTFTGVFDGHLGDMTVEHVAHHLPIIVKEFLEKEETRLGVGKLEPQFISELFVKAIVAFDDAIAGDVLNLVGGSLDTLNESTDPQIAKLINDQDDGGVNWRKVRLSMYGTTALVSLVDPDHEDLWIANLGDCQAIFVTPGAHDGDWRVEVLTSTHNGDNVAEIERILKSHPDEPECVSDGRILGALAPTRCLGDIPFKQPASYTRRILYNLSPGFHQTSPWEEFLKRNRTPPYVTAEPQIIYRRLKADPGPPTRKRPVFWAGGSDHPPPPPPPRPRFLILASDGFGDLCAREGVSAVVESWARNMTLRRPPEVVTDSQPSSPHDNMALRLLRRALGGENRMAVSRVLTLDMSTSWIDDTSIVIQTI